MLVAFGRYAAIVIRMIGKKSTYIEKSTVKYKRKASIAPCQKHKKRLL